MPVYGLTDEEDGTDIEQTQQTPAETEAAEVLLAQRPKSSTKTEVTETKMNGVYKPTSYGTYKTAAGEEFIKNKAGKYVRIIVQNPGTGEGQNGVPGTIQQSVINISAGIGTLEEFKSNDDWNVYCERFQQYCSANYIDETRKVSVLITLIGPEVYKTLRDLCDSVFPHYKTYLELCEIL